jgi:hypothetical protein
MPVTVDVGFACDGLVWHRSHFTFHAGASYLTQSTGSITQSATSRPWLYV